MLYVAEGGKELAIDQTGLEKLLLGYIKEAGLAPKKVLLLPPDHTRLYSYSGVIADFLYHYFTEAGVEVDIMPTLGTHVAMSEKQLRMMFGERIPLDKFLVHDWRNDVREVGELPPEFIEEITDGKCDFNVKCMFNNILFDGGYDLFLSIGQVVPHEVVGMSNYSKNICVGVGGSDLINKSHFVGAACNMEKALGRTDTPVRKLFDTAYDKFLSHLPVHFIHTVVGKGEGREDYPLRGLFISDDRSSFEEAAKLSRQVNLDLLDKPIKKCVCYLTPKEFASTWLGNKAVYRTRMAIETGGELIVLAPGVHEFGEDPGNDKLIRKYGYKGTPATLEAVAMDEELGASLGAAAHLIHGSSEGRFKITYCTDSEKMSKDEVENAGFAWADYHEMIKKYDPETLVDGWQEVDGEEIFYISNPAIGLWALKSNF